MAATPQSNQSPSDRAGTAVPVTFDEKLNQFWSRNRTVVLGVCALVLVAILGKGLWEMMEAKKEKEVEVAYADAKTPDQLRAFAASHSDHELAGIAQLRIADQAYAGGKVGEAATAYDQALASLKDGALVSRAKLGRALANVQAGKQTDGETQLKQLADDTNEFKAIRSQAAYELATLAVDARNTADAEKYIGQLNQIDPGSVWARRALALQANLPRSAPSVGPTLPSLPPTKK